MSALPAAVLLLLSCAGIRPGRDLSLLSFDNRPEFSLYPLSTVDIGFANLGYRLAHLCVGDVPVQADAGRVIRARPVLVDRGSLTHG